MRFAALSALAAAASTAAASTVHAARSDLATATVEPTSTFRNVVVVTDVPNAKHLGLLPGEYTIKEFHKVSRTPDCPPTPSSLIMSSRVGQENKKAKFKYTRKWTSANFLAKPDLRFAMPPQRRKCDWVPGQVRLCR
ncbi:hypothetical protein PG984_011274 [Apiospora sp. TS-2023a]